MSATTDYHIRPISTTDARTADAIIVNRDGVWLGEWTATAHGARADYLTDEDGDYLPAPRNWRELVQR
jgi:hypothetical protein